MRFWVKAGGCTGASGKALLIEFQAILDASGAGIVSVGIR